ncbi:MAG: hypothetical protein ACQES2_00105 [Pseudomonadota bacterium]
MPTTDLHYELARWFASPSGQRLQAEVNQLLPDILTSLPGTDHLQVDTGQWPGLYQNARQARYDELFHADASADIHPSSLDSVLLLHCLDVTREPHRVLHIADQWLARSGYLVLVGFNPWSFWGLLRLFMRWWRRSPWESGFYSLFRIRDWLKVLNYEVQFQTSVGHIPPLQCWGHSPLIGRIEHFMTWLLPQFGAVNIIVAKRPLYPMTPVRKHFASSEFDKSIGGMPAGTTRQPHRSR